MELTYFDKDTNQTKTIQTEPIHIEVIGGDKTVQKQSLIEVSPKTKLKTVTKTKVVVQKEDSYLKYIFLLVGFMAGVLSSIAFNRYKSKETKRENNILKAIKKAKSDKELFYILLPYAKRDEVISQALNKLEENIYKDGQAIK